MIFKLAGSGIVMFSAVMWGFYMASKEYFRLKDLREMKRGFDILRSEIEYGMSQLDEASMNVSAKCSEPVKGIFGNFSNNINTKGDTLTAWGEAVSIHGESSYFNHQDLDMFITFGKTLGYLDKNMQLNSINMQVDYIDAQIDKLEGSWEKSRKMYLSLGTLGGGLVVILLL